MKQKTTENTHAGERFRLFFGNLNPKRWSVRWKITFYFLLFTALILTILWLLQVAFLDDIYQNIKLNEIVKSADRIEAAADSDKFGEITAGIADENNICVFVFDATRQEVIASEDVLPDCTIHKAFLTQTRVGTYCNYINVYSMFNYTVERGGSALIYSTGERSEQYRELFPDAVLPDDAETSIIYIRITETSQGNTVGIFLNSIITPVSATVKTLNSMLSYISLILVVIALILASVISADISRPLHRLSESAKILATGNYDVHFGNKGYREVSELGDSLNYAAQELSKVDKLRSELLANISHDLRTPLTLISGYAEIMKDLPDEITAENIQIIIDESNRLKNLVNDALDISLLQSDSVKFNFETFPLTNCIESELTRYGKLRGYEGYVISFESDRPVNVVGDREKIMRAFFNLVNNAVNYTGEDKKVSVASAVVDEGKTVRVSVTDTGAGISKEDIGLIWDRYYKVDKTHRRASVGTGIGLSIVKEVIEAHNGRYGVDSTEGEGSTFWFELPVANDDNAPSEV